MASGAELPSVKQILSIASEFGLDLSEAEASSYQNLMKGPMTSYRRLEEFSEYKPEVKYKRDSGYRPTTEENHIMPGTGDVRLKEQIQVYLTAMT